MTLSLALVAGCSSADQSSSGAETTPPSSTAVDASVASTPPAADDDASIQYVNTEPYLVMSPEELSALDAVEKAALWNSIAQGTLGRQSFDEFSQEYYSFNTDNTQPGKPTTPPPPPSVENTAGEIREHNAARIRYISAFSNQSSSDFNRDQMIAVSLFFGVNSESYGVWRGFWSEMPDAYTGKTAALNKGFPLAGEVTSATPVNTDEQIPWISITGPNVEKTASSTVNYMFVEAPYTRDDGTTVTLGNWMVQ